ncbi:uncharacterized protein LOC112572390 [Pomacea canaliculata]|uniref:uncharacterized protein LOC112572390 n=1 Tax=Pomacea canaliculata TaxID=400727 RepID=UPI000D734F01|nr:uncharacterized protein LOC112572390 [Pomacea canaliculata]
MSQHSRRSSVSSQGRTRRDSAAGLSRLTSMTRRDSSTSVGTGRLGMLASALALRRKVSSVLAVKESKAKDYWKKLRFWMHIIYVLARIVKTLTRTAIKDPASPFYSPEDDLHDLTPSSVDKDHYMFFDPSFFKANRQMRMSQEAVRILTKPPADRSAAEIQFIITSFRGISTIAELPVRMQKNLARFGYFECYEAKRMILKQGRKPMAFYFILYGKVVEAVKDDETGLAKIVCHMQRGESFGELAIINHSVRCSSVLTQSYTELLAIPDSDYQRIYMIGNSSKSTNDPDLHQFLSSLAFLRGWPVEKVTDDADPHNVTFGYFKRKAVVVKDSNVCDWLIVVKSGAVSVLKRLAKVKATVSRRTGQYKRTTSTSRYLSFLGHAKDYARWLHYHSISLPPPLSVTDNEDGCDVSEDKSDELCLEGVGRDYKEEEENEEFNHCDDMAIQAVSRAMRPHTGHVGNQTDIRTRLRKAWSAKDGGSRAARMSRTGNFKTVKIKFDMETAAVNTNDQRTLADNRSCTDNSDSRSSAREVRGLAAAAAEVNPQFVLVHTLTKGDVFGLSSLVFLDQPSLCLVSNGAECLLIKKRFYLDNCPPDLMRRLKVEVSPYPSEKKLQQDLVDRVNWDIYKSVVRRQVTGHKQLKVPTLRFPATLAKC